MAKSIKCWQKSHQPPPKHRSLLFSAVLAPLATSRPARRWQWSAKPKHPTRGMPTIANAPWTPKFAKGRCSGAGERKAIEHKYYAQVAASVIIFLSNIFFCFFAMSSSGKIFEDLGVFSRMTIKYLPLVRAERSTQAVMEHHQTRHWWLVTSHQRKGSQ